MELLRVAGKLASMLLMDQQSKRDSLRGKWGRWRWAWLALAAIGVLSTPGAILDAINLNRSEHRLGFITVIAFSIRFAQIYGFTWLWWKTRPYKAT
jgi:Na+/H+ antiporter NhaA